MMCIYIVLLGRKLVQVNLIQLHKQDHLRVGGKVRESQAIPKVPLVDNIMCNAKSLII